jgi:dihydroorotate dehydrogenase
LGLSLVDQLLEVIGRHRVSGIICSNLTKNRDNKEIKDNNLPDVGGMSGKVVDGLANELISHVYKKTAGRYVIVGCGGVFSAEDAYKKIRLGASLIQLITGMVYSGPQLIGQINRGLVALLKRDGFTNISQAIGIDSK